LNAVLTPTDPRAEQSLAAIAVDLPGATALFRRLKLDFCCGGQVALDVACAAKGLDTDAVLAELARLERPAASDGEGAGLDPSALVDHILERYHEVHRAQLPELIKMARRVEAVHRGHPELPEGLADLLEQMEEEMLEHMAKEEQILFPLFKAGGHPMVADPILVMRDEHVAHGAQLERLAALTRDHEPPAEACNTWRALYAGTRQFTDDLMQHIHLENNLLFPAFERAADR
jgi:regulator of cell morphogenesis and NO signaling